MDGINFVVGYVLAVVATLQWARVVLRRPVPLRSDRAAAPLTVDELACLAGGTARVVEAAVGRLFDAGTLRFGPAGVLRAAAGDGAGRVEAAVLAEVRRGSHSTVAALAHRLAHHREVAAISARLAELGLLAGVELTRARRRIALLPLAFVTLVGVARVVVQALTGRELLLQAAVSLGFAAVVLVAVAWRPAARRTRFGEDVLTQARRRIGLRDSVSAAESVALYGLLGHPDPQVRGVLPIAV
ncbi:TIGR04222 domain-containing membrane protein [Solihabitans fulvus]|uniref:TIGR04222 domain-containing membrane protein n=1 Tax=Solihabitans fulvus TaxID=1892852 RepID=A0A5B2XU00_9PSEU|nr:TIGR04222 domain-containing membrane protein [Solihabitans fulvus]KAA2266976.1 TIGR04222 domain-containing membrane protein [Solihabitans fulvus]